MDDPESSLLGSCALGTGRGGSASVFAGCGGAGRKIVLESTPNGAGGLFYEEWQRADDTGYTRHFFPWWFDAAYVLVPGADFAATEEEAQLAALRGLKIEQIAWRRKR